MDINAFLLRQSFWIKDYLRHSPIGKPYREIKFLSESSYEKGFPLRSKKLKDLLRFARDNTAFYKNIQSDNLSDYPVQNKLSLIANYDKLKVDKDKIPGQCGKVHIQKTSGSTGTPLAIPQDTMKRNRRVAELKYFGKIVGFNSHEKLIHLRTWNRWQNKTTKQIKKENIVPFDISQMDDKHIDELCSLINLEKAVCLRGYASSFGLLARYVKEHGYKFPTLKIVIAGSETLHDDVRIEVKKNLNCEIISQYADEECGILAQERIPTSEKDNVMYLNHADYYFEILKFDSDEPAGYGELGRIVITDLHNYAFPIIRYDTGDAGILLPPDKFSHGYPVLGKLFGRRMDLCFTTDGNVFSPMAIGRIMKHYNFVIQWQFIQKEEKRYCLKLVYEKVGEELSELLLSLKEIVGQDAMIDIVKVDEIPVLASGKRKPVVNEWKLT